MGLPIHDSLGLKKTILPKGRGFGVHSYPRRLRGTLAAAKHLALCATQLSQTHDIRQSSPTNLKCSCAYTYGLRLIVCFRDGNLNASLDAECPRRQRPPESDGSCDLFSGVVRKRGHWRRWQESCMSRPTAACPRNEERSETCVNYSG